jgi:hypothetical protein
MRMNEQVIPTYELIKQAKSDYERLKTIQVPSKLLTPMEKSFRKIEFGPTADIRGITLPKIENNFLKVVAQFFGMPREEYLAIAIERLLVVHPDRINASLDEISSSPETIKIARCELTPDVFVPLAETAMEHPTSSSLLARVALDQIYYR